MSQSLPYVGIMLWALLQVTFIALKVLDYIQWPWWQVFVVSMVVTALIVTALQLLAVLVVLLIIS